MKKRHLISAAILAGIMAACGQKETASSDLIYLNYQETKIQKEAPKLSTLLKDIRYVALETKDTCLLNRPTNITLTDKYIVMDGGDKTECFAHTDGTESISVPSVCAKTRDLRDIHGRLILCM